VSRITGTCIVTGIVTIGCRPLNCKSFHHFIWRQNYTRFSLPKYVVVHGILQVDEVQKSNNPKNESYILDFGKTGVDECFVNWETAGLSWDTGDGSLIIYDCRLLRSFLKCFFFCGAATQRGSWLPHSWGFYIAHNDASQSVGLLWTSDQLVAETSTWQHTTLTTDKQPYSGWDSNPRSQQASGRRPTP